MMWARDTAYPPITMCAKRGPLGPIPTTVYLTTVGLGMVIATLGSVTKGSVSMMWARDTAYRPITMCAKQGRGGSSLNDLLGTWRFRYTIISTFTSTYRLSQVDTSTGTSLIVGTNEYGNPVAAGRIQDVNPGNPLPHEFALLDPGSIICQLFVFDKTGINRVEGFYFQIRSPNGQCGGTVSDPYQMTGTRTSQAQSSIQGQLAPQGTVLEQSNAEIQSLEETTPLDLSSPDEADSTAIRDMINMLSSTLD